MFLARITFGRCGDDTDQRDRLKDIAEEYLSSLLKNGQICGDYLIAWSNATLVGYTHVARPDALARRHHSDWAKSALEAVAKAFGQLPRCEVIDDDVPSRFRSWKRSTSLYVFTHAFHDASPLWCGDTGNAIPPYLLPMPQQWCEDVYFWAGSYKQHDNLWLGSAALEIPAYKQLADPTSDLSITGRKLCSELEHVTGKPTYYYLHRYWGRKRDEAERTCPLCSRKWSSGETQNDQQPFNQFHFRCDRCRLVSHNAVSFEDERHARIGEFAKVK